MLVPFIPPKNTDNTSYKANIFPHAKYLFMNFVGEVHEAL